MSKIVESLKSLSMENGQQKHETERIANNVGEFTFSLEEIVTKKDKGDGFGRTYVLGLCGTDRLDFFAYDLFSCTICI